MIGLHIRPVRGRRIVVIVGQQRIGRLLTGRQGTVGDKGIDHIGIVGCTGIFIVPFIDTEDTNMTNILLAGEVNIGLLIQGRF